jgi:putative tricarboxylic transport membrane protein
MRGEDRIIGLILMIVSILICLGAAGLHVGKLSDPGSGLFPFTLGVLTGFLSLILLIKTPAKRTEAKETRTWRTVIGGERDVFWVLFATILYGVLLIELGFLLTTFLLFVLLLKGIYRKKWYVVIGWALIISIGSYILFDVFLHVQLPTGVYGP